MAKITTISEATIDKMLADIEQLKRMVHGGLRGEELPLRNAPDDIVVYVPTGGIPARSGKTCTAVVCDGYRIADSDMTDLEFDLETLLAGTDGPMTFKVFNLSNVAVEEDKYVVTARLKSGHRYVVVESCIAEGG